MVATLSVSSSPPHGFVALPNLVLLDRRLSRGARLLFAVLKRHARQRSICWPGYRSLCRDLAACEDTVRRWMRELIAAGHTEREIGEMLGADSLRYLSLAGLRRAMGKPDGNGFCFACFTGSYPVDVPAQLEMDKLALEIPVAVSS